MKIRKIKRNTLSFYNTVALAGAVFAAAQLKAPSNAFANAVPKAVYEACKYDYKRLCRHYEPGTPKMRSCMQASVGQLSPRCYDTLIRYGYGRPGMHGSLN